MRKKKKENQYERKGKTTKESITKIKDIKKNNCYRNQAADWIKITNCIKF